MSRMAIFDVPLAELRTRGTIKWQRFEADVIPMFVAEMDAHIAPAVRERLERALREGDTGYPQLPTYQEAFADYAEWQWGWRPRVASRSSRRFPRGQEGAKKVRMRPARPVGARHIVSW